MKSLSSETLAHLEGETTTFAVFWKIEKRDGTVLGFSSHVEDIEIDGVTYLKNTGIFPSNVQVRVGKAVDNLQVLGLISSPTLSEAELLRGDFDDARVLLFLQSYEDTSLDPIILLRGGIGEVKVGKTSFEAEVHSLIRRAMQTIGKACSASCRSVLGDSDCQVNLTPFTFSGSVSAVDSASKIKTTSSALTSKPEFYFAWGRLTFTSGPNSGRTYEVRAHTFGTSPMSITLSEIPASTPTVGDTFDIVAGCDLTLDTCRDKFDNVLRFAGEPYVPGADAVIRVIKS